jgi:predicted nucleotidyltransferase
MPGTGPRSDGGPHRDLEALRRAETALPVAPPIAAIAEAARARHGAVAAVIFYGSCLRLGSDDGRIVDLYLVVDSYRAAYGFGLRAFMNWALPPNVFYLETPFEERRVRAKYAVVSRADFAAGAGGRWFHPYLWARFAQPCRLAWCRDEAARQAVVAGLAGAVRKCVAEGLALVGGHFGVGELWVALFRQTYRSELRAEPPERASEIHAADAGHYLAVAEAVLPGLGARRVEGGPGWLNPAGARGAAGFKWALRRLQGKLLSVARLAKAAFTFQGGADYLLWKIERHSGVSIALTPWQRRHPLLASTVLFWRLYRRGAFR